MDLVQYPPLRLPGEKVDGTSYLGAVAGRGVVAGRESCFDQFE